jgi:hypothetical protein
MRRFGMIAAALAAAIYLVFGVWALVAPRSFFDQIATYPPYNKHFVHDLGAFQVGIGVAALTGLWARDALVAGLAGAAAGSVGHAISHLVDEELGGHDIDPYATVALAVVLVVATWAAASRKRAR